VASLDFSPAVNAFSDAHENHHPLVSAFHHVLLTPATESYELEDDSTSVDKSATATALCTHCMPHTVCHLFPTNAFIITHEGTSTSTANDISLYLASTDDHPTICLEEQVTSAVGSKDAPAFNHA
jgi:hypothetical protein